MKKTEIIRRELLHIAAKHDGLLDPEHVVDAARPTNSRLHSKFNWDNTEAAHLYRVWQARQLISVCVEQCPLDNKPMDVFVSLTPDRGKGGYRVMAEVLSNKQMREQMLLDALSELDIFQKKYNCLRELSRVFSAAKAVRRSGVKHSTQRRAVAA